MIFRGSIMKKLTNGRKRNVKKDGEEITGLSTRTVKYIHTVLSGALKQAVKEGLIPANPADATTQPRQVKKEITPLSAEQVRYFLDNIKANWLYPVFVTDLGTGLRRGELLGLKWDVVNLKDGTATIRRSLIQVKGKVFLQEDTKTKSSTATVKLPNTVVKELRKVKKQQAQYKLILGKAYQDSDFVFTWPDGRYIRPDYLYHQYKNLLKENGLPDTRFHDLRHTFCTMLLESGEELSTVSKLARHSSFSITADIYGHLTTNMQNQAAEKIDAILKIK
jgi:integrase